MRRAEQPFEPRPARRARGPGWRAGALVVAMACAADGATDATTDEATTDDAPAAGEATVTLTTADGVDLVADVLSPASSTRGILLLHMNPSGPFTRADWASALRTRLRDEANAHVLVLDRRGAGDSAGVAKDAYEGPGGRLDVAAAVAHLTGLGVTSLAIVGASNGTTSMVDYTVDPIGLVPERLLFLTGGTYTENQTAMTALPTVPALFVYGDAESTWSEAQQGVQTGWTFAEIAGGAHGTRMFDGPERDDVFDRIVGFVAP